MSNEAINKYLTGQLGECWHTLGKPNNFHILKCTKCGVCGLIGREIVINDFFIWPGFGKLWEWATKQEWWGNFIFEHIEDDIQKTMIHYKFINPTNFANAIYEFLQGER